jgi:ribosome biogenesis GTP-binding protein YsxC/EngB
MKPVVMRGHVLLFVLWLRVSSGFQSPPSGFGCRALPGPPRIQAFSTRRRRGRQRAATVLRANVASELVRRNKTDTTDGHLESRRNAGAVLSRPERKALERQRKAARTNTNHRKHNFSERRRDSTGRDEGAAREGRYDLHSTIVTALNGTSTPDDVMRAIKRAQNLHDEHDLANIERFIFERTDASFAYGYRGSLLSRLAVAALHVGNHELARRAIDVRLHEHRLSVRPMESAALIRGLLRVHNVSDALEILEDELALPVAAESGPLSDPANRDRIKHRALSIASVASRHFFEREPSMALLACRKLADLGPAVREAGLGADDLRVPWSRVVAGAAECEAGRRNGTVAACAGVDVQLPCNLVHAVLNAFLAFPTENSDDVYEALSNALIRRVTFVTGAVDMGSCPRSDGRGEAVFIGRSNAGKSSLINMLTNRKSLAFTSKRPGKTQQFNFFAVNDKPGIEKEIRYGDVVPGSKDADSFYLVDVPGIGYAKVPEKQRDQWSSFLMEYMSTRQTLRCVFHLIDSRLGPTEDDESIMRQLSQSLVRSAVYVVVLTKADKNVKSASKRNPGKVSRDVLQSLQLSIKNSGINGRHTPIILSSSETKLGRDEIWRYLRLAAEGS